MDSSSDDDDLLMVMDILLWDAEQKALPKHRGSARGRPVVNRCRAARRLVLHDDYYKPAVKTPKMADKEHAQTSRKRVADKQINKDNPESDDDSSEQEAGIFDKASEEVMATRRIVKVQHQQPLSTPSNPFSAVRFTPSDSNVQASIPFSKPPPSDVTLSNVKGSCSSEKTNEGCNCSVKDAGSNADSDEAAEIQKDGSGLKESNAKTKFRAPTDAHTPLVETIKKAENTEDVTGEDKVLVGEPKADNSKPSGSEIEDGDAKAAVETHKAKKDSDA